MEIFPSALLQNVQTVRKCSNLLDSVGENEWSSFNCIVNNILFCVLVCVAAFSFHRTNQVGTTHYTASHISKLWTQFLCCKASIKKGDLQEVMNGRNTISCLLFLCQGPSTSTQVESHSLSWITCMLHTDWYALLALLLAPGVNEMLSAY